jgi:hypothetical protein
MQVKYLKGLGKALSPFVKPHDTSGSRDIKRPSDCRGTTAMRVAYECSTDVYCQYNTLCYFYVKLFNTLIHKEYKNAGKDLCPQGSISQIFFYGGEAKSF